MFQEMATPSASDDAAPGIETPPSPMPSNPPGRTLAAVADCTLGNRRTWSTTSRQKRGPVLSVYSDMPRSTVASSTPVGLNPGFVDPACCKARRKRPAVATSTRLKVTCATTKVLRSLERGERPSESDLNAAET